MSVMKKLGLDPKHYKHVKSDDKTTTLQHKHGHVLTIAHNVLSPSMQTQLKALSKVGKENQTDSQAQEAQDQNPKMADGGSVSKEMNETIVIPDKGYGKIIRTGLKDGGPVQHETPGPDNLTYCEGGKAEMNKGGEAISNDPKQQPMSMPNFADGGIFGKIGDAWKSLNSDSIQAQTQDLDQAKSKDLVDAPDKQQNPYEGQKLYADGGEVDQSGEQEPMAKSAGKKLRELIANDPHVKEADAVFKGIGHLITHDAPNFISGLTGSEETKPAQQPSQPQPQIQPAPQPDQTQQVQPQAQPQQQDPMDQSIQQSQGMLEQGYQNQLAGLQQESQAKGQLGQQQANQIEQNLQVQNSARNAFQQSYQALENERQGIMNDIQEGHIDPEQYWKGDSNGEGGHSKIMTGLGIILAGFNPTSNPNAALNFLKFQMEQNLNAQAKNLDSKQNLLRANLQQFGNMRDAADMTRLQQADILHNQMLMAANKAASPMAKAEMLQKAGQLEMSYAPLRQQFALRQAMMNLAQNGTNGNNPGDTRAFEHTLQYMRMMNPEMAKEMESRLIPGVGVSKIPIPNEVRQELVSHQKLSDAANDVMAFSKSHNTIIPGTPEYNSGVSKTMILQQMIREGLLGTVFRESEKPLLNKMVNENPAGLFKELSTQPKLRTLLESNVQQMNALKSQYGLPTQQTQPQQQPIKGKDGKMYIRQGNYMVPTN